MRKVNLILAIAIVSVVFFGNQVLAGQVITVDDDGPADYSTIQDAIDAAADGDIVLVADGIYAGAWISGVVHGSKAITVRSANGPKNCIIDGGGECGFWFYRTGTTDCRLEGFTVSNCQYDFGAIYCSEGSSPTITNCIVTNNGNPHGVPHYRGIAGIRCDSASSPTISNCLIVDNYFRAEYDGVGGGIFCAYGCNPTVTNCTIVDNTSYNKGGAIYCKNNCNIKINNCILWANSPNEIILVSGSTASVTCSNVQGGWPGEGNINADPLFASGPLGNYYLSQVAAGQESNSPCVDAGSDQASVLGMSIHTTRTDEVFDNGIVDMGYHYPAWLPVEIEIHPDTLNLSSNGKWISCHIWLPEEYDVANVNTNSILLEGQIAADQVWVNEEEQVVMTKFSRAEVQDIIEAGEVELTISGKLLDGAEFEGTDTIRVIDKGSRKD